MQGIADMRAYPPEKPLQGMTGFEHMPPHAYQEPVEGMRGILDMRA